MRKICRLALERIGLAVDSAESRAQARDLLLRKTYDLVLTDVQMATPTEGVSLAEDVKQRSPDTAVVVMTAAPSLETAIAALKHGASDYLAKPFEPARLEHVVRHCLDRQRLARELDQERTLRKELESAYAELQKVEKLKDGFLARINHELRTPVGVAVMAAGALKGELAGAKALRLWAKLDTALHGLDAIVEELVLHAELAAKTFVLELENADLIDVLKGVVERHRPLWEERRLTVDLDGRGEPRPLRVDRRLLETAISHLLRNAIRFNEAEGKILIRWSYGEQVTLSFEDTGIGIPEEQLAQVFDGFYQVAEHLTRQAGGLGLGLATVRRIMEAHRGSVTVKRCEPRGTRFTLILP
ncbi:MAG: response regulator [Elusimicrobia bacterium]|nr:response regulator [Elusimicrobiota bacterium]